MNRLSALAASLLALPMAAAGQARALRLVDRSPAAAETATAPGASEAWPRDFAAARAAAKQRHVLLLLFFTAKW